MKLIALALLAVCCSGYPTEQDVSYDVISKQYRTSAQEYFNTVFTPRGESFDARKINLYLYNNQEPWRVKLNTQDLLWSLTNSSYDIKRPTKILIHDWLFSAGYSKELITAYLRHFHKPVNVIVVDYSYYSIVDYKSFMSMYQEIGVVVGKLLGELHRYGTIGDKIHMIGHGAGAHIAAVAARQVSPFQVSRITGLDPIGLAFDEDKGLPQLEKRDADFVDVILTNVGEIGSKRHRAHVTFYPSGGVQQPSSTMFQSHLKAYFYYVESIVRGKVFQAYEADSYTDFRAGKYDHSKMNYMGEFALKNESGKFYLEVNPYPGYSLSHDVQYNPNKMRLYETYLTLAPKNLLHPWGFTREEEEYTKKMQVMGVGVVEGQSGEFGKAPHYYHERSIY